MARRAIAKGKDKMKVKEAINKLKQVHQNAELVTIRHCSHIIEKLPEELQYCDIVVIPRQHSKQSKKWNKEVNLNTPILYFNSGEIGAQVTRTYPASISWTENGQDLIMVKDVNEPVLLERVKKDSSSVKKDLTTNYCKTI